ncbi:hypothetical protein GGX14DRAFT_563291 [Mycena pura]|uniref:Uncharacterized protein n=1 Tax=Mycena pura TaxID=153505 RepID=A0AAD6VKT0_9AGAR|nr:hypothetical protein GGX14DRAFT_563291 [Mycena pura]
MHVVTKKTPKNRKVKPAKGDAGVGVRSSGDAEDVDAEIVVPDEGELAAGKRKRRPNQNYADFWRHANDKGDDLDVPGFLPRTRLTSQSPIRRAERRALPITRRSAPPPGSRPQAHGLQGSLQKDCAVVRVYGHSPARRVGLPSSTSWYCTARLSSRTRSPATRPRSPRIIGRATRPPTQRTAPPNTAAPRARPPAAIQEPFQILVPRQLARMTRTDPWPHYVLPRCLRFCVAAYTASPNTDDPGALLQLPFAVAFKENWTIHHLSPHRALAPPSGDDADLPRRSSPPGRRAVLPLARASRCRCRLGTRLLPPPAFLPASGGGCGVVAAVHATCYLHVQTCARSSTAPVAIDTHSAVPPSLRPLSSRPLAACSARRPHSGALAAARLSPSASATPPAIPSLRDFAPLSPRYTHSSVPRAQRARPMPFAIRIPLWDHSLPPPPLGRAGGERKIAAAAYRLHVSGAPTPSTRSCTLASRLGVHGCSCAPTAPKTSPYDPPPAPAALSVPLPRRRGALRFASASYPSISDSEPPPRFALRW